MPRLEDFMANLVKSRLVSPDEIERVRVQLPAGSESDAAKRLAQAMVDRNLITRYQANKILNGRTWGFFLGGYRILKRLGEGGMGKVYLARRERDGRRVAIKVLPPKKALEDEQALKRFYREMELSRRVRHPNVTRTLEVGKVGDTHFMVMEYVPGDSLYNLIKQEHGGTGPMRVPDAARYIIKVLSGLHAAHEAGLVHRDIKPSNLMITPDGDAKILDLGLARATGEESPLTHPNAVVGTLDYASPEQLANASTADRRSDLYSIGCTLYFVLSGRPPFEGGDIVSKIFRHRMDEAEPLEKIAPGVPPAFAAIVRKLMAKDPDDRYQSAPELIRDLTPWTDPDRVKALVGAQAERARAFRPPPPDLVEEDIRLDRDPSHGSGISVLRDLGEAESPSAPMAKPPPMPRTALILEDDEVAEPPEPMLPRKVSHDADLQWVIRFSILALIVGLIAVLLITALQSTGS